MPDDDQHTLKLLKVKSTDVGEMTFIASNEYGSESCTFNVEMAGERKICQCDCWVTCSIQPVKGNETSFAFVFLSIAPPTFETIMEDLDVCAGETPRFAVVVEGKPVPDILWFKVGILYSYRFIILLLYPINKCSEVCDQWVLMILLLQCHYTGFEIKQSG